MKNRFDSNRYRSVGILLIGMIAATTIFSFQNCGGGFKDLAASNSIFSSTSFNTGSFVISQPSSQSVNLGTTTKVPLIFSSDTLYNAPVSLIVRASDLQALSQLDPGASISISFDRPGFVLAPSSTATSNVIITISTMAPSLTGQSIHIDAVNPFTTHVVATATLQVQINAIYDVNIYPATTAEPENWSLAAGASVGFISHPEGLKVRFNNYDSQTHLIHSDGGPIPHESLSTPYAGTSVIGIPSSPDGGTTAGGIYENVVTAGTTMQVSQVHCHLHEAEAQNRTLSFNLPAPVAAPTPTATPTSPAGPTPTATPISSAATYTQVNANIISVSCANCHFGTNPTSGISLVGYSGLVAQVTPGNAAASSLYIAVSSGSMPKGGPALSAAQVQEIKSWINSGAPNN